MKKIYLFLSLLLVSIVSRAQTYTMPSSGTSSATTCGGSFYDSGGPSGNYLCCNLTGTYTIYPSIPGAKVSVSFSSFTVETCCDYLRIYNGNSTSAPLVGQYNSTPPTVTSTATDGSLTFYFRSDVSITYAGFVATLSLVGGTGGITTQPAANTTVCSGDPVSLTVGTTGTNTYQWFNNGTTNSTTGGSAISGATDATYSPSTSVAGTTYYYCEVTNPCTSGTTNTARVEVGQNASAISGVSSICPDETTVMTNTVSPGTWSSSAGSVASIDASTGVVTALSAGTTNISYTVTSSGCTKTKLLTVNTIPAPIMGTLSVCEGSGTTLSSSDVGGTWTSGSVGIATIDPVTGALSGISAGLTNISYATSAATCVRVAEASVNPLPALTVTPSAPTTICFGETTPLSASSPNPTFAILSQNFEGGLSGWTVDNTTGGPANFWQIVNTGSSTAGIAGDGSQMAQCAPFFSLTGSILTSPSFSTVGYGSAVLSFNQHLLSDGSESVIAIEYSVGGGPWTTLASQVGDVIGSGAWSAGSPEFSLALPAGAIGQSDVRLRWNYNGASFWWYLDNISVSAALPASTYEWSGAFGLSCTTCTNPDVTPTGTGANTYNITVTSSAGCTTTGAATVNVNPLPNPISGNLNTCVGSTNMLSSTSAGGTWSSSNPAVATISGTGAMTGISTGTTSITYTLSTGCKTISVATVAPAPAAITGTPTVCEGQATALSHSSIGGVWSSSMTSVATVNSFGAVSGIAAGTSMITYTLPSGCTVWQQVTVNATPSAIVGADEVCSASSVTFTNATSGGFWSSSSAATASVSSAGVVTGGDAGISIITYTMPTTCYVTKPIQVNPLPAAIGGATEVCVGSTAMVTNSTSGGTWSGTVIPFATVSASGVVTGYAAGVITTTYTLSTGCQVTHPFTINALPSNITGLTEVCEEGLIALSSSPSGGTWSSSSPTKLSIDGGSGVATGMDAGVVTVNYTLSTGCSQSTTVTVNALPEPISGTAVVCNGATTTLYDFTPGGSWSSGNILIADVTPSGLVTGTGAGQAQISYSLSTGCLKTQIVTVNPLPGAITGIFSVCVGSTTTLGNPDAGGMWSSSNASVASVDAGGVVTGNAQGMATITYTLVTGCMITQEVTVNPLPGIISGPSSVCEGSTITLGNSATGGLWTSSTPSIATVNALGEVTGQNAGTTTIVYTLPTGCERSKVIAVNVTPTIPSGGTSVCMGQSTMLSSTPSGGTWSSGSVVTATVTGGTVTGNTPGNTTIMYTLSTGCSSMTAFTVNALPANIMGNRQVCVNSTTLLSDATSGGTWSSSDPIVATVDGAGNVMGMNNGTSVITYTLPTGCMRSNVVTVNPLPAPISGVLNVCSGSSTTLTDATPGGTWSTSAASTAMVASSGIVSGVNAGSASISYTLLTGCYSVATMIVNPLPSDITGATEVCVGSSITLSNVTPGGSWMSMSPGIASVDGSGVVTGNGAGSATIVYSLPTGCQKSMSVLVNPLPAPIVGNTTICENTTTMLGSASAGGTWSSSDVAVATINASGRATGLSSGFSIITYTLPTTCKTTQSLIVNNLPDAISGDATVCAGLTTTLTNTIGGGTWSAATDVAMVNTSGEVLGIAAGTTTITYTIGNSCYRTRVVTVNPLPGLLAGVNSVCPENTIVLSNSYPDGTWTSDNSVVAGINVTTGVVTGVTPGVANITYTLPTGCMRSKEVTVHDPVDPIVGTLYACKGTTTFLSNATPGGVWISNNTPVARIATSGAVTGVDIGTSLISYVLPTGCLSTSVVTVNGLPANITGASGVCEGSIVTLSNTTAGGSWTSSDDAIATIDATGTVSGIAPGSAAITYTINGTGCMKSRTIMVNALPMTQNVTGGGSYCAGGTGVSVGLDGSESGVSYRLLNGSAAVVTMTGTGGSLDFGMQTAAGMYTVSAMTGAGCSAVMAGDASIVVNALVTPSVSVSSDMGDEVCDGTLTTYTATGADGGSTPTYTWSVNGTDVGATDTYSYTPADGDDVVVRYMSSEACPSVAEVSAMIRMHVIANETPAITVTSVNGDSLCQGDIAYFNTTIAHGGDAPSYTWVVGGSIVSTATSSSYSYMPTKGETVVCRLNSNYACITGNNVSSNVINLRVDSLYIPEVEVIATPGTIVEEGQQVTFTTMVNKAGDAPTYQWYINNVAISGETGTSFTYSEFNDGDSVTCKVVGTGHCGKETINSVVLSVGPATGVAQTGWSASDLRLVPNPNSGTFVLSGNLGSVAEETVSVQITDMLGQVVYNNVLRVQNGSINERISLSGALANGMYMLNVSNGAERKVFHFVLKQ